MPTRRGTRGGKSERCFVQLDNRLHYIPPARWHHWVAIGVLILVSSHVAKPAVDGVVRYEDGELHVPPDPRAPWMLLNCRQIENHLKYHEPDRRYFIVPEERQEAIQRDYYRRD